MENVKSKSDAIKFDIKATLLTTQNDELLDDVFREFCSVDYPRLHKMNEDGLLSDKIKNHIKEVFKFIITNKSYLDDYVMFTNRTGQATGQATEEVDEFEETEVSAEEKPKEKKKPNRPRVRINKSKVEKVKETDDSICHTGALAILRLKNIHPRLERTYANETLFNEPLTEDQWKQIIGVIDTTEKKINQILKGK